MNDIATRPDYQTISKPLPKLVPSQKDLYELIHDTCISGELLNTSKAFQIYKKHAKGKAWYSRYSPNHEKANKEGYIYVLEEWQPYEWERNYKIWLLHTLGRLVITGYLKIMPAIDFSELKIEENVKVG